MRDDDHLFSWLDSRGLRLERTRDRGRAIFAKRPFRRGEVVLSQQPYAWALADDVIAQRCSFCCGPATSKCSRCEEVRYCGQTCQRKAWPMHQQACKAQGERKLPATLRLIVRILARRMLKSSAGGVDEGALVWSLESHFKDMPSERLLLYAQMSSLLQSVGAISATQGSADSAKQQSANQQSAGSANQQPAGPADQESDDLQQATDRSKQQMFDVKDVTELLCRVSCNAHSLCDDEARPFGLGLYPIVSLVNHSCHPNAVLHFDLKPAAPPLAELRATEAISLGDEVTFSYIDIAVATDTRRTVLQEQYFFGCACRRCNNSLTKQGIEEDAALAGVQCPKGCPGVVTSSKAGAAAGTLLICGSCGAEVDAQKADISMKNVVGLAAQGEVLQKQGRLEEARGALIEAERKQARILHSQHAELRRTRDQLMKVCLDLQDFASAAHYCRLTLPAYERAYPPYSPLLGLQWAALGKLDWYLERPPEAAAALRKALGVLEVTHGGGNALVAQLAALLQEVQLESARGGR